MSTLVLIPTYNEAAGIRKNLLKIREHHPDIDILVIDDNSPDGTAIHVLEIALNDPKVFLLKREGKQGLGKAYFAGFRWGLEQNYKRFVQMDSDGSHRAEDLTALLDSDADLVIGSRWIRGGAVANWPKHRELISRAGNLYARLATGLRLKDLTAGFRIYSRDLIEKLISEDLEAQGYGFQIEMTRRANGAGASIQEIPILFIERELGSSKMTKEIVIEALTLCTRWGIDRLLRR